MIMKIEILKSNYTNQYPHNKKYIEEFKKSSRKQDPIFGLFTGEELSEFIKKEWGLS